MEGGKHTSKRLTGLNSFVSVKGLAYKVQTVLVPNKPPFVITNALLNETVVDTIKASFPANREIPMNVVRKLMKQQHEKMIQKLKLKHVATNMSKGEYMRKIRKHISNGNLNEALNLNEDALALYPNNPFFLTYLGYLKAAVLNKHKEGVGICKRAIDIYQSKMKDGEENYLSYFYLNLGRVYLVAGKKDFAINSYHKGLKCDPRNKETIMELAMLGIRKPPPVYFLERSNPVNKYLGLLLSRVGLR